MEIEHDHKNAIRVSDSDSGNDWWARSRLRSLRRMSWVGASILPMPTSFTTERRNGAGAIYAWHDQARLQECKSRVGASTIPMPARLIPWQDRYSAGGPGPGYPDGYDPNVFAH